jgi:fatty acid desaturase
MPTDARFARAMKARNPKWYAQLRTEWIAYGVFCAVLLAISWKKFLLYVVLPHQYAAWGIISINFLQHDGCDPDSEHNHSRNFVGRFVNWITFNNGYHGMHHEKPGLHWSLLPEAHRVHLHPHIHPSLEQKSLLAYIFRAFIWPARRVRYDGAPMDPPVDGPDVDWIEPLLQGPLPRDAMAEA